MRLGIDTSRHTDLVRGVDGVPDVLERAEAVYLPFIVLAELRAGFSMGRYRLRNEAVLRRFLAKPGVQALYPDEQTTHQYAAVYRQLRAQGTPIPTDDLWIAALVLQHSLLLFARDRHFEHLPQIALF